MDGFTTFTDNSYQNTSCHNSFYDVKVNQFGSYDIYSNGKIVRENVPDGELANYGHQAISNFLLTGVYFWNNQV